MIDWLRYRYWRLSLSDIAWYHVVTDAARLGYRNVYQYWESEIA